MFSLFSKGTHTNDGEQVLVFLKVIFNNTTVLSLLVRIRFLSYANTDMVMYMLCICLLILSFNKEMGFLLIQFNIIYRITNLK